MRRRDLLFFTGLALVLLLPMLALSDEMGGQKKVQAEGVLLDDYYYDDPYYEEYAFDLMYGGGGVEGVIPGSELGIEVETFTTETGFDAWRVVIPGGRPLATPAVGDGLVYIGGGFGSYEFYAFSGESGQAEWMFQTGDDGPTAAVFSQGRVAFNTESCILYVLDARRGHKVWGEWLGDPLMAQPAIQGDYIYMTYPGGDGHHHLTCRKLETGETIWDQPIIGEVITAPIIADGSVYAACLEGTVYRFDAKDGDIVWKEQMNATCAPFVYSGEVYVSQRQEGDETDEYGQVQYEGLARLDSESGSRENDALWQMRKADYLRHSVNARSAYASEQMAADSSVGFSTAPGAAKLEQGQMNVGWGTVSGIWAYQGSRPVVVEGLSYSTAHDALVCTDIETGEVIYEITYQPEGEVLGGRMLTPPSWAGGKLYVGTEDGFIVCFRASDGTELWRVEIGEPIRFQPAVEGGWVYVGTDRGTLIAFNTDDYRATGWAMWGGDSTHNAPN
ncbi:PQQ-binding-like beta-propeller repeat protein [bacterium]|nr:PQQ-binding-like beta-propeller repeat protein [bacterium]